MFGGVETGGTWVVCALGNGPDDLRDRIQFRTASPAETITRIADYFVEAGAHQEDSLEGIGIGAFGPLDLDARSPTYGHLTQTPKPGWQRVDLLGALTRRLREGFGASTPPIRLDSDVTAAALAEQRWGAGRGCETVAYLTVGTGIGAGLVRGGRPDRGLGHPEAGHIRVPRDLAVDRFPGACPIHGDCWEGLAAGGAIHARTGTAPEQLDPDDPVWALVAGYLAAGVHALLSIVRPERLVAGGGVLEHPGLLEQVRTQVAALDRGYLGLVDAELERLIVPPELGDDAGVLGAIALAGLAEPGGRLP